LHGCPGKLSTVRVVDARVTGRRAMSERIRSIAWNYVRKTTLNVYIADCIIDDPDLCNRYNM